MIDACLRCQGRGCMYCCQRCNLDTHRCPGCGIPIEHDEYCCEKCDPNAPPEEVDELYWLTP